MKIGRLLNYRQLLDHGTRREYPAQPKPRRQHLREAADVDHQLRAQRPQRGKSGPAVAQLAEDVVLEYGDAELARQLDQLRTRLRRHGASGRIVEIRDRVDQLAAIPAE